MNNKHVTVNFKAPSDDIEWLKSYSKSFNHNVSQVLRKVISEYKKFDEDKSDSKNCSK